MKKATYARPTKVIQPRFRYKIVERWATGPEVTITGTGDSEAEALNDISSKRPQEGFMRLQQRDRRFVQEGDE